MSKPVHRPRRIAADEAHAWARNLRLGNPLAKLLLCMLALYVNGDGECFASINQLADDTELDRKTIMGRLAWLENAGLIVRRTQWCDMAGVRNSDGRGRRTSDLIVLQIDQREINSPVEPDAGTGTPDGPERSAPGTIKPAVRSVSGPLAVHLGGPQYEPEPELRDEGESARAREPLISEVAQKLAEDCLVALGFEPDHPPVGWYGLAYDCEVLVKRGCDPPLVVATVANFRGTDKPKSYILKAVHTAHQNQSGSYAKTRRTGESNGGKSSDWRTRRDAKHDALAELSASVAADRRREEGG